LGKAFLSDLTIEIIKNKPTNINKVTNESSNTRDITVSAERKKPLPTISINYPNRVHWDNLAFEVKATLKERINEEKTIQISTLEITKEQWNRLYNQPFALDFNGHWYTVKTMKEIVLVPFKKYPSSVQLNKNYDQVIRDKNHRGTKLLAAAKVNDYIYFEQINVGEAFTFGLGVKIIDNQPTNSTGFIPKENIQFDEKDALMSMDGYPPAFQNYTSPALKIDAFLPEDRPTNVLLWSRIPPKKDPVYIIDGVKYTMVRERIKP